MPSDRFDDAVSQIYAAALEPHLWPTALHAIAKVLDDVGAILIYRRDDGTFGVIASPAIEPCLLEYQAHWAARDTRANRAHEKGYFVARDVITDRDVISKEEMTTDPFYADFLPRYGLRYFAAAMVSPDPHVEVALSIQRVIAKPEYNDVELAVAARLGQHVERALRLSLRLMDAELIKMGLGSALSRIGIAVFALDSLGRVVFSNAASKALLGDGIDIVNDRLRFERLENEQHALVLTALETGAQVDEATKPILIPRRESPRPLALHVMPITRVEASVSNQFLTHARTIVIVVDPEAGGPPDPALIRDVLGLTLGEARIASSVGSGMPPRAAAAKLGIAEATARSVLKRVFAKLGVSRQSELTALISRLMLRS